MTFFQFIAICFVTIYVSSLIYALMAKFENLSLGSRNQSLSSMMTGGEFSSDIPLHIQIKEMADEAGVTEVVQLEELDHEFDHVDIERVKEKLIKKNQLISEIILEI